MATIDDVRAIALALPGVTERVNGHTGTPEWRADRGGFVWERDPRKTDLAHLAALGREWPDGVVIGVRTDGPDEKQALLEMHPAVFFTIPHFDGYPAILVRLDRIDLDQLRELIEGAWLLKAPPRLARQWLDGQGG